MFEEDYERCFICQQPCKGLYCSSECRIQDKGTPSPAIKPLNAPNPVRLTSQIPVHLSPLLRPMHHHIAPSPRLPPSHADSSSSSSITSSPIQSPSSPARAAQTGADSPQKDAFDLPPLAYPHQATIPSSLAFSGSMPVKIPSLAARASPQVHAHGAHTPHTPAVHGSVIPSGTSIDTLRFGRKPGLVNSVTSPNALLPRCACGKPANHRGRALSRDRGLEPGLANLILGPAVTSHEPPQRTGRIVSESAASPQVKPQYIQSSTVSGYNTPDPMKYADGRGAASLLSRSRSDPIPPSPKAGGETGNAPTPNRAPASRRASNAQDRPLALSPVASTQIPVKQDFAAIAPPSLAASPRRGRSRDRGALTRDVDMTHVGFNHPPDREQAPSRSRHRREVRDERRRSGDDSRERGRKTVEHAPDLVADHPAPIMPSWHRRTTSADRRAGDVAPSNMRRTGSGGGHRAPEATSEAERKRDALRHASQKLSNVFGIAAG